MADLRPDASFERRGNWVVVAARPVHRLVSTHLERMGDQLRFFAPDFPGEKRWANHDGLEEKVARPLSAFSGPWHGAFDGVATLARIDAVFVSRSSGACSRHAAIRVVALVFPLAGIRMARQDARIAASQSTTGFKAVCRVAPFA